MAGKNQGSDSRRIRRLKSGPGLLRTPGPNHLLVLLVIVAGFTTLGRAAQGDDPLARRGSWQPPKAEEVKAQVDAWVKTVTLNEVQKEQIKALWPDEGGPQAPAEMVEQLAVTAAIIHPEASKLVTLVGRERKHPLPPKFEFLHPEGKENEPPQPPREEASREQDSPQQAERQPPSSTLPAFLRKNLRLFYGRWLAQHELYDESLEQIKTLTADEVADPATLLFYQAVGHHKLLQKKKCLPVIERLLERESEIPRRYETVARLMEADIKPLEEDSLDEIARLMDNIRRRLDLGRAGKQVRTEEELVLAKLDKMIDQMEKQQQQQQQQAGGSGQSPSQPLPDSVPAGGRGPGNVDQRDIGRGSGWGDLPPRERQEALQEITKDLPAHYRTVVEEYFRKLARNKSPD